MNAKRKRPKAKTDRFESERLLFQTQNDEIKAKIYFSKAKIYFSTSKSLSNIYFLIMDLITLHSKCFFALFKLISLLASIYFLVAVLIIFIRKSFFALFIYFCFQKGEMCLSVFWHKNSSIEYSLSSWHSMYRFLQVHVVTSQYSYT